MTAKLNVLGSSSHGNGYVLSTSKEKLLLECGVPFRYYLKALDYKLDDISGVLVSHAHRDHAEHIPSCLNYRLDVYSNEEVANKYKGVQAMEERKKHKTGGFTVMPLKVPHNAENYAYVIDHEEFGRLVFATDLQHFRYKIQGVNHLLVEANYDESLLVDAMCDGADIRSRSEHHMEIEKTIDAIRLNCTPVLQSIVLLHLSDNYSNAKDFRENIYKEFHVPTFVADKGVTVDISKYDF